MDTTPDIITKLTQWLCFTVIISLLPLSFSLFRLGKESKVKTTKEVFDHVLSNGDILIVGVAIIGDAIGSLISTNKDIPTVLQIIFGAMCVLLISFLSYCYAEFSAETNQTSEQNQFAVKTSVILFIASVITSGICKILTI